MSEERRKAGRKRSRIEELSDDEKDILTPLGEAEDSAGLGGEEDDSMNFEDDDDSSSNDEHAPRPWEVSTTTEHVENGENDAAAADNNNVDDDSCGSAPDHPWIYTGGETIPSDLQYVIIHKDVTTIPSRVFEEHANLIAITFQADSACIQIGDFAVYRNPQLVVVEIPPSCVEIGSYAFYKCSKLSQVEISPNSSSLKIIKPSAFSGCSSLQMLRLPKSLQRIGRRAFANCTSLISVGLPLSEEELIQQVEVARDAFEGTTSSAGFPWNRDGRGFNKETPWLYKHSGCYVPHDVKFVKVTIPNIPNEAFLDGSFDGHEALTWVQLQGIQRIGRRAFYRCKSLAMVEVAEGFENTLVHIDSEAFSLCTSLRDIALPDPLPRIARDAFDRTLVKSSKLPWNRNGRGFDATTPFIYMGNGKDHALPEDVQFVEIDKNVEVIPEREFSYHKHLSTITFQSPSACRSIRNYAFFNCDKLTTVELPPDGLIQSIQEQTFAKCTSLQFIQIPESVNEIQTEAFSGCTLLSDILLPEHLTEIHRYAFKGTQIRSTGMPWNKDGKGFHPENPYLCKDGCKDGTIPDDVEYVEISKLVKSIGNAIDGWDDTYYSSPFKNHQHVISVTFQSPSACTKIEPEAFQGCPKLATVEIPMSMPLQSIERDSFRDCKSLNCIRLPSSVTSVRRTAFRGTSVSSKGFPWNMEGRGFDLALPWVYQGDGGVIPHDVMYVKLHKGCTSVGNRTFSKCFELTTVQMPASLEQFGSWAFEGCSASLKLTLPKEQEWANTQRNMEMLRGTKSTILVHSRDLAPSRKEVSNRHIFTEGVIVAESNKLMRMREEDFDEEFRPEGEDEIINHWDFYNSLLLEDGCMRVDVDSIKGLLYDDGNPYDVGNFCALEFRYRSTFSDGTTRITPGPRFGEFVEGGNVYINGYDTGLGEAREQEMKLEQGEHIHGVRVYQFGNDGEDELITGITFVTSNARELHFGNRCGVCYPKAMMVHGLKIVAFTGRMRNGRLRQFGYFAKPRRWDVVGPYVLLRSLRRTGRAGSTIADGDDVISAAIVSLVSLENDDVFRLILEFLI